MNEANFAARPPRKRRSFLWLWILLLLTAFTGGIVLGLKLNTLPLPNDVQSRLYPVLEAIIPGSTAVRPQEEARVPVVTPAPAETPAAVIAPAPTPAALDLPPVPMEQTVRPEPTPEPEPEAEPFEILTAAASDETRFESAPVKSIGIDAALEAALENAEVEKKDAEITGVYRTKDEDGQSVYEVSFKVGEIRYEYIVGAYDGEILGWRMTGMHAEDVATFGGAAETTVATETDKK